MPRDFVRRVPHLVDLVPLIKTASVQHEDVRAAVWTTFARRNTHRIPVDLPDPPPAWAEEFAAMAGEAQLRATTLTAAMGTLCSFRRQVIV